MLVGISVGHLSIALVVWRWGVGITSAVDRLKLASKLLHAIINNTDDLRHLSQSRGVKGVEDTIQSRGVDGGRVVQ